jgi:hypothetical protein
MAILAVIAAAQALIQLHRALSVAQTASAALLGSTKHPGPNQHVRVAAQALIQLQRALRVAQTAPAALLDTTK